jgi:hypothetical protein
MRLKALLPDLRFPLRARARSAAQLAAVALCLGGCGTLDTAPGASSQFRYGGPTYRPNGPVYPIPSKVYIRDMMTVELQRDHLDRYVCAAHRPLTCQCFGGVSQTCDCHC